MVANNGHQQKKHLNNKNLRNTQKASPVFSQQMLLVPCKHCKSSINIISVNVKDFSWPIHLHETTSHISKNASRILWLSLYFVSWFADVSISKLITVFSTRSIVAITCRPWQWHHHHHELLSVLSSLQTHQTNRWRKPIELHDPDASDNTL